MTKNEAGAAPKPSLALTDGTMRLNGHLAAEIGMTPSILLLQLEWMIRHLDSAIFKDGKWWIAASARSLSKKWFKGCITHETICRNLDKLEDLKLIIQAGGEKQGDKRLIALDPDGCASLESVTFEQRERPSENVTEGENTVTKPDGGRQKSRRVKDAEASENLTVPVIKSDAVLEDIEESKNKEEDSSQDQPPQAPPTPAAAAAAFDTEAHKAYQSNFGLLTPILADAISAAVEEFTEPWCVDAIQEARLSGGKSWNYVRRILERWKREGRTEKPSATASSSVSQMDQLLQQKREFEARFGKPAEIGATT